jgi:hypothetical protein
MEEIILDKPENSKDLNLIDVVKRWESKRLKYNVIMGLVDIVIIFIELLTSSSYFRIEYIFEAILFGILANIAFCVVYLVELISKFNNKSFLKERAAKSLYYAGLLFSIFVTVIIGILVIIVDSSPF